MTSALSLRLQPSKPPLASFLTLPRVWYEQGATQTWPDPSLSLATPQCREVNGILPDVPQDPVPQ